ncbi:MAG: ATP-binding protein [Solirubrobacteraceae bacterium]
MTAAAEVDTVRVFLLDDTRELRHRVRQALCDEDGLTVVGEADDPVDGLPHIEDLQPDVVVCDLSMPRMDGLEAIPRIADCAPEAGIVIFSGFLSDVLGATALELGADRYVEKSSPLADLAEAVRDVARARRAGVRPARKRAVAVPPPPPARAAPTPPPRPAAPTSEQRALEAVLGDASPRTRRLAYAGSYLLLAVGAGLSLALDLVPAAFLMLFLGPVAVVGALARPWAGILISFVTAGAFAVCARAAMVPTWEAGTIGVLVGALTLAVGAHRLVAWMHERVERQAALARELARSNAEIEQFAYVASHDLAAPLRTISSLTTMLGRRYEGRLDPEADKMIGFITAGTDRMQRMIDDLLAFARAGRVDSGATAFELAEVLDRVRADLAAQIGERGAKVHHGPLPRLVADEPRIGQVLLNLVSNAIKFCPADRAPIVEVSAARLTAGWRIDVRDNGIGVDPRFASKVFGMFQRLHVEEEFPGTGIGLAICQRIVERHGGRIWVDGFEGQGSTFSFTIPDPA